MSLHKYKLVDTWRSVFYCRKLDIDNRVLIIQLIMRTFPNDKFTNSFCL